MVGRFSTDFSEVRGLVSRGFQFQDEWIATLLCTELWKRSVKDSSWWKEEGQSSALIWNKFGHELWWLGLLSKKLALEFFARITAFPH